MKLACSLVLFACVLALSFAAPSGGDEVLAKLAELDSANLVRARALTDELVALGEDAALAALAADPSAFVALPLDARRARAHIARHAGGVTAIAPAIARLADLDQEVRRDLLRVVTDPRDAAALAVERASALEERVHRDESDDLRALALRGLARLDHDAARSALERVLRGGASRERMLAARALTAHARARERVVRLVQDAFAPGADGRASLFDDALETLLAEGYGAALAETPGGGDTEVDRAPFVMGALHRSPRVREAAAMALQRFVERLRALGEWRRAERTLTALARRGLDDHDLLYRRATLALQAGGDPELARDCAREMRRLQPLDNTRVGLERHASAALLEALCDIALEQPASAHRALAEADSVLVRLGEAGATAAAESIDERPSEALVVAAALRFEVLSLRAVVELYRVIVLLQSGRDAGEREVLEQARATDLALLEAQRVASSVGALRVSLDDLFGHRLGPTSLIFGSSRKRGLSADGALELERALYQAFANVTGGVPGFVPAPALEARLSSRLTDQDRRALLERCQSARFEAEDNALNEALEKAQENKARDLNELNEIERRRQTMQWLHRRERRDGEVALARQIEPSQAGLVLAERLREHGRAEAARELATRVRDAFDAARDAFANSFEAESILARAETTLGGALMDENEGGRAEERYLAALARLEALDEDPRIAGDERNSALVRAQLSNVLVSLAVNANVKQRRPERALEYFERAFELQQNDFMRVLLACYRARAGKHDEAREVLRAVPPSPGNFYNLACTHALLGDVELALDFLRRDLDDLRGAGGSRERQKEWARGDPDLASLRGDPRFIELVRPTGEAAGK